MKTVVKKKMRVTSCQIIMLTAFLLLGCAERAFACSCAGQDLHEAVLNADYIFIGTILSRQDTPPDPRGIVSSADPAYFEVSVERMLKGQQPSPAIVVTVRSSASCGYPFRLGTRYLIFGYRLDLKIGTNLCTMTTAKHVDAVAAQVDALLAKPQDTSHEREPKSSERQ